MISIQGKHVLLLALGIAVAASCPFPSQAFDDELTGEHLESLLPEDVDGYMLEDVNVKTSSPSARGVYQSDAGDATINLAIHYGEDAAERYQEGRGKFTMGAAQGKMNVGSFSVHNQTFVSAHIGDRFIAMAYFNHFLVGVNAEGLDDPKTAVMNFLQTVGMNRFTEWSPPEDLKFKLAEPGFDGPGCLDMSCFSEHLSRCEEARLIGALGRRVTATYTIEEKLSNGQCQISLVFTDNPNPKWENTPLYFTMDPAEGFSMDVMKEVVDDCVEGEGERYDCNGPLLDRMENQ